MVNTFKLDEERRSALKNELPEIANLDIWKHKKVNIAFDRKFHKARVLLVGSMIGLNATLGVVIAWNLKNMLGIDLFEGPHHEFIDVLNGMIGI